MLRYPCLVLDHDDTVVQTEKVMGYPYFCKILQEFRPGQTISFPDYVRDCHDYGFTGMCERRWQFTKEEQKLEYSGWIEYLMDNIPPVFSGIGDVIHRQRENGGLVCVVSHSSEKNITRDYREHFGILPDAIYGWDYPKHQCKPNPFPLEDIMRRFSLTPKDILVVDDAQLACQMAYPLGIDVAFAAWSKEEFPELSALMAESCRYTFHTPKELENFLFSSLDNCGIIL